MLEVVVAAVAAVLVLVGTAVIAGPWLRPLWRRAWPPARGRTLQLPQTPRLGRPAPPPPSGLHPTTTRALTTAARAYSLLRANGADGVAQELKSAARLVRQDEAKGLLALAAVLRPMRNVVMPEDAVQARYHRLVSELREAVKDRSEQLELLHFR